MPWYAYALYALFVIVCLLLIGVVLLQPGKGDIALFGGGSQTAFGPRGAQKPLERVTFALAGVFMALAFLFSVPGILSPRSVASGIKDEPPAKEQKPEDKKPEDKKEPGAAGAPGDAAPAPDADPGKGASSGESKADPNAAPEGAKGSGGQPEDVKK